MEDRTTRPRWNRHALQCPGLRHEFLTETGSVDVSGTKLVKTLEETDVVEENVEHLVDKVVHSNMVGIGFRNEGIKVVLVR
jgi:ubiquinone biosynthesis protein UbiJ